MSKRGQWRNWLVPVPRRTSLDHFGGAATGHVFGNVSGGTAVEFALLAPALIFLIFGILELGRASWTLSALSFAAESAARCAAVDQSNCATTTQIQNHAVAFAAGLGIPPSTFTVSTQACGRQVVASFAFVSVAPIISSIPITLSARACYPI